jgi:predicted PurR-regulated permease PerM
MSVSTAEWTKRSAVFVAIALIPALIWFLSGFILVAMGAVMVAVLLRLVAEPFWRWLKLPKSVALALSGLLIIFFIAGTGYLFGSRIGEELQDVIQRAGQAQASIAASMKGSELGELILSHMKAGELSVTSIVTRVFTISVSFLGAVVVSVIAGIYIAAQPALYRDGLISLFPSRFRARAKETIDDLAIALRLWLLGQLVQMLIIGVLSTLAVSLIGLPSPAALGLIAGIAEFLPYVGPILAAIPALLVAATQGLDAVAWTAVAYLLIHQTEGNLIVPIIQRYMIYIPPAVVLLGIVAITFVLGSIAIIFATPIAVVVFVLVKKVYVRDSLGEPTPLPGDLGEHNDHAG